MQTGYAILSVGLFLGGLGASWAVASEEDAAAKPQPVWHDSYSEARKEAEQSGRYLCIVFDDPQQQEAGDTMCRQLTSHPDFSQLSEKFVLARLPKNTVVQSGGKSTLLLKHGAFTEMRGKPGISILDFTDSKSPHYSYVVSVYPRFPVPQSDMLRLLRLPSGSLTQRTLILAVRMHPERPQSTEGDVHSLLAGEAAGHSQHQAQITRQGHHNFDSRFHRINARLRGGLMVQEVVAESWPGQGLFDAAVECVSSWRQSSGHWSAVRSRHHAFGYDMKRGANGVWYATGLFARP